MSALSPAGNVGQAFGEAVEPMDLERGMVLHEGDGTTAAFRPLNWNIWRKLDPIPIIRLVPRRI